MPAYRLAYLPPRESDGQRQRVAVARAIAIDSEVLLMDEPLSNLDALLRLEMRADLKRLLRSSSKISNLKDQIVHFIISFKVSCTIS